MEFEVKVRISVDQKAAQHQNDALFNNGQVTRADLGEAFENIIERALLEAGKVRGFPDIVTGVKALAL